MVEDATDPRYRLLVRTAFTTGARWGELIAIRGTDIEKRGAGFVVKIHWLPAIEKAGVSGLRVHDMRRSAISWWVAARIPLADVRDRAGHSSIAVTNTYVLAVPGDDDPFAAFFEEAA